MFFETRKKLRAWMEHRLQMSLKRYVLSMEDKMMAGAFRCATNYEWDSLFKLIILPLEYKQRLTNVGFVWQMSWTGKPCPFTIQNLIKLQFPKLWHFMVLWFVTVTWINGKLEIRMIFFKQLCFWDVQWVVLTCASHNRAPFYQQELVR